MKKIVVATILAAFSLAAYADDAPLGACNSAAEYLDKNTIDDPVGATACVVYIRGVIETYGMLSAHLPEEKRLYCLPSGVSHAELAKVVRNWVDGNPEKMHHIATKVVFLSLREAFPCPL